jgi:O-acetylserine/cysteine efflux transporter
VDSREGDGIGGINLSGIGLAALVCLAWGFNAVAIKVAADEFSPLFAAGLRCAIVFLCFLPWLRPAPKGQGWMLGIATFVKGALHFALIYFGTQLSNASIMAIVGQLYVPFAALMAMLWLTERVSWLRWAGIAVAFVGMAIFSADGNVAVHWLGLIILVADAVAMAVGTVMFRKLSGVSPWVMQAWMAAQAFPILLAASFAFETGQVAALASSPWEGWAALVYTVVGGSLVGFTAYYLLLQRYEVSLVAGMLLVSPVISVFAGVLMLDEPFTLQLALGAFITLAGVGVILMREPVRTLKPTEGV